MKVIEPDSGATEKHLNTSLAIIASAMEFIINLVSKHVEMIQHEAWVHFFLLYKKMAILDLKMEQMQLENKKLMFCMDNLGHAENINAEENVNERDDDIMAIDQGSFPSQVEPPHVTFDIEDM